MRQHAHRCHVDLPYTVTYDKHTHSSVFILFQLEESKRGKAPIGRKAKILVKQKTGSAAKPASRAAAHAKAHRKYTLEEAEEVSVTLHKDVCRACALCVRVDVVVMSWSEVTHEEGHIFVFFKYRRMIPFAVLHVDFHFLTRLKQRDHDEAEGSVEENEEHTAESRESADGV